MFLGKTVAVVIPAYNEERLIARTLEGLPAWVDQAIVVDDASRDRTSEVARRTKRPGLHVARHEENRGVGAALSTGYRLALERGAELVAVMAGDAQMDPADLAALLAPLAHGEADYTKGNRLAHPEVWRTMPLARLAGTFLLARLTRPLSGYWGLEDSQCGYTAISRAALLRLDLEGLYPRYGYPNDLLIQLGARRQRLAEVPVRPVYGDEQSGFRPLTVAPKILFVLGRAAARRALYHLRQPR